MEHALSLGLRTHIKNLGVELGLVASAFNLSAREVEASFFFLGQLHLHPKF